MGRQDRYRIASHVYDASTLLWSGGAIWRTRAAAVDAARPGDTVLLPGPGTGRSAARAAKRGAFVVAPDLSPAMLARAARRVRRAGAAVGLVRGSLDSIDDAARFDVVVCEHFLNVFDEREMPRVRSRLVDLVRPGGTLTIADFAPAPERGAAAALQRAYHWLPLGGCALLTGNARHPIHDHGAGLAKDRRVDLVRTYDARVLGLGPRWFRTWFFRRT